MAVKILITGGAGYIGSCVTNLLLNEGHRVTAVDALWFDRRIPLLFRDNPNYRFIKGDIGDSKISEEAMKEGVDYVIHAAAVVGDPAAKKFPELTYRTNYEISVELIERLRHSNVRGFVFLSTCSNYGVSDGFASEESPLKPLSLYAETKVNVERYLMDKVKDLDWVICRLSTAYGLSRRMRFDLTINDFAKKAVIAKYIDIFLPHTHRPYMHVQDIAQALSKIMERFDFVKNDVLNIGFDSENYQKIRIAEIIRDHIPEVRIEVIKKGDDLRDYRVSFKKLERILGMRNEYTAERGIREIIDSIKSGAFNDINDDRYYNTHPNLRV